MNAFEGASGLRLIVGTRGSALARAQTDMAVVRLQALRPDLEITIQIIKTKGDLVQHKPLAGIGDRGLFTREIEAALLDGRIDLAVHSLKDLPTDLPPGLAIGAVLEREDARDVLVSRRGYSLDSLPLGARVGTGSLRRAAQILAYRPDLRIVDIRGNVDTRLRKAATEEYDAVVLAAAGLHRLGLAHYITAYLPLEVMLPAVGQGALAIEVRADDDGQGDEANSRDAQICRLASLLDDFPTRAATAAERAFLRALGGGCRVPVAAYGEVVPATTAQGLPDGDSSGVGLGLLRLRGLVASPDGRQVWRGEIKGKPEEAEALGEELAQQCRRAFKL